MPYYRACNSFHQGIFYIKVWLYTKPAPNNITIDKSMSLGITNYLIIGINDNEKRMAMIVNECIDIYVWWPHRMVAKVSSEVLMMVRLKSMGSNYDMSCDVGNGDSCKRSQVWSRHVPLGFYVITLNWSALVSV